MAISENGKNGFFAMSAAVVGACLGAIAAMTVSPSITIREHEEFKQRIEDRFKDIEREISQASVRIEKEVSDLSGRIGEAQGFIEAHKKAGK
jgi:gas vesicle protein